MPFDPYWEWFKIPPERRPPSHRELLGVDPDEADLKKIREAASKRHEHLKQFVISPQEEVAAHAKRLLKDVGAALAALRRAVTAGTDDRQPKPSPWRTEIRDGASDEVLPVPIIVGLGEDLPPLLGETTPTLIVEVVSVPSADGAVPPTAAPTIPPPIPAHVTPGGWHGHPPPVAPPPVVPPPKARGAPTGAEPAAPPDPEALFFEEVLGPDGQLLIDAADLVLPPRQRPGRPGRLYRWLRWLAHVTLPPIRRFPSRGLRLAAACPRAVFGWGVGGVRRVDGLLRLAAGEENAILHGFFRVLAMASLAVVLVFAVPPLVAGLSKLASALVASSEEAGRVQPGPGPALPGREKVTNEIGMEFVLIPAGEFGMGSEDSDAEALPDESPRHPVKITKPYYLGVHEVTVGQFRRFVDETGHRTDAQRRGRQETWESPGFQQTDDHPVAYVSWDDAVAFCGWLSKKEGREYRLPTEAEWEYACRAQDTALLGSGGEAAGVGQYAWWEENAGQKTHPVGRKQHNAWGLYDMLGNVAEWCQDRYADSYAGGEETDPQGPALGMFRVLRGGSAASPRKVVRPAFRSFAAPDNSDLTGFRVVLVPADLETAKPAPTPAEGKTPAEANAAPTPTPRAAGQIPKEINNEIGIKLVLIPEGEFTMGSRGPPDPDPDADGDETPQHRVQITRPFYLGIHEVTVGQFRKFVDATAHRTDAEGTPGGPTWRDPGFTQEDDHPVVRVSWNDADAFCKWLSKQEGKTYRLPTEAEWEYACRAGTSTAYSFGDDRAELAEYAWFDQSETHPVGRKKPNAWGLYDVHGNAEEWCADWYDDGYYAASPPQDPAGPESGNSRVVRSMDLFGNRKSTRSAFRFMRAAGQSDRFSGFRVARDP